MIPRSSFAGESHVCTQRNIARWLLQYDKLREPAVCLVLSKSGVAEKL